MRGRPKKQPNQLPEVEAISEIEEEDQPEREAPWWTTDEVAKALEIGVDTVRKTARAMELFAEAKKGKRNKYSMTDVLMIRKEIIRERAVKKRNKMEKIAELKEMLNAKDRGEF